MDLLYALIYGMVSGLAEMLPISAPAHQQLLRYLFGVGQTDHLLNLFVHIGLLGAVCLAYRNSLKVFFRGEKRRRGRYGPDTGAVYDLRLVKTAAIFMVVVMLVAMNAAQGLQHYVYLTVFFAVNGIFLYIPQHVRQSNKEARHMTGLDGLLLGVLSGLSVFSGLSRTGLCISGGLLRGAEQKNAVNWAFLLTIPAMVVLILFDFGFMATGTLGAVNFARVAMCLLSGAVAFGCGFGAIRLMNFLAVRTGFYGFAYYSWGAAFFSLILYLIT